MNENDIIVAFQQRNLSMVHRLKGIQAALQDKAWLIERDGVRDPEKLVKSLRFLATNLHRACEDLQTDPRNY